ncbi:MAG: molybdopterin-dependent oxidoreductase [Bradymonadia bacterium]
MAEHPQLLVNGQTCLIREPGARTLLEVLRYELNLTGTKQGCDKGDCGACTVLVNGSPRLACCTLAATVGRDEDIVTIEGLSNRAELDVVQQAFDITGALQCGFCQPGMMLSARSLLNHNPAPSRIEIREALGGNLCRCTGYVQIVDAVELASEMQRAGAMKALNEFTAENKPAQKVDGIAKATGRLEYTDDLSVAGMLHCKILRSPHPHARLVSIDTSVAAALPGVHAVVTGADLSEKFGVLPWTQDETALAVDTVRFVGDEVAAVAADSEEIALEALELIDVEYDQLPSALCPTEAQTPGMAPLHPTKSGLNVHKAVSLSFGDVDTAQQHAKYSIDGSYYFHGTAHAPIEPHCALARYDQRDGLTVWSSTQIPHYVHRALSRTLNLLADQIRVIQPAVGGAFGGKSDPFSHEIIVAHLSMITGRPVKVLLTREETFYTHRGRHPMHMEMRLSADENGKLTGLKSEIILDGGAYSSFGVVTTYYAGQLISAPTHVENYAFNAKRIFTNKPPCGPKRGHGSVQPRFAFEVQLDKLARLMECCPIELRRDNDLGAGQTTINGHRIGSNGFLACLDAVEAASDWRNRWGKLPYGHGLGVAGSMYISGTAYPIIGKDLPQSIVEIRIDRMGVVYVSCGASDIGQGCETMLAQVTAEGLGIDQSRVKVITGDTRLTPVDLGAYSSRVTLMCGQACDAAARQLRTRLDRAAGILMGEQSNVPELKDEMYRTATGMMSWLDIVVFEESRSGPLFCVGTYDTDTTLGGDYRGGSIGASPAYSFTAHVVEVTVDIETGEYQVNKIWAAHDCGYAVNPALVRGQIEGSVYMGWAEAVMEEQSFTYGGTNPGLLRGPSLLDYPIPTSVETPHIESIIIESEPERGVSGVKEAGEGPLHPVLPALANAIFDAVGVRIDRLPIRASDVFAALQRQRTPHAAD